MTAFRWYRANGDGTADIFDDSPTICQLVDSSTGPVWFGSPEGAILYGGVIATAFKQTVEQTYDATAWLLRGEKIPAGEITMTEITATGDLRSAREGA